jgi:hypothetical protein
MQTKGETLWRLCISCIQEIGVIGGRSLELFSLHRRTSCAGRGDHLFVAWIREKRSHVRGSQQSRLARDGTSCLFSACRGLRGCCAEDGQTDRPFRHEGREQELQLSTAREATTSASASGRTSAWGARVTTLRILRLSTWDRRYCRVGVGAG